MRRRFDNDHRVKTFDTWTGGTMVTGVKLSGRYPAKLWIVGPEGALGMLSIKPGPGGGFEFELAAEPTRTFDMQGLTFETVSFSSVPSAAPSNPLAQAEPRPLELGALTVEEEAAAEAGAR